MKARTTGLFAAALLVTLAISSTPGYSSTEKPAKVKTGAVCKQAIPKKASAKDTKKIIEKTSQRLPRLVDLGAKKCIPCKMMVPILDSLKKDYKGRLEVEFIDVWENRSASEKYKIQAIPTQIFFDASGREFYRHTGFFPKEDILAKFKEHKINLDSKPSKTAKPAKKAKR